MVHGVKRTLAHCVAIRSRNNAEGCYYNRFDKRWHRMGKRDNAKRNRPQRGGKRVFFFEMGE